MAALAQNGPGTVHFAETKTSALLKTPIESSGTLTYAAPSRLEKRTLAPRDDSHETANLVLWLALRVLRRCARTTRAHAPRSRS